MPEREIDWSKSPLLDLKNWSPKCGAAYAGGGNPFCCIYCVLVQGHDGNHRFEWPDSATERNPR